MKTTIALLLTLLFVSTAFAGSVAESDKPANCLATGADYAREAGKDVDNDEEETVEEIIEVQSA